jgi:hypothetical protein
MNIIEKHFRLSLLISLFIGFLTAIPALHATVTTEPIQAIKTTDYELNISIDYEKEMIFCQSQLQITNTCNEPVQEIPLLLYRLLSVSSITDGQNQPLPFTQTVTQFEDWGQMQVNCLKVQLPHGLSKGEKTTLKIDYSGFLLGYSETGMRYVKDKIDKDFTILRLDAYAYPSIGFPSWKRNRALGMQSFDYLIKVTVPKTKTVANGGQLIDKITTNDQVTFVYKNIKKAWRMDIAIADYQEITHPQNDKIKVFCFPEHRQGAEDVLKTIDATMKLYTQWFGPLKDFTHFSIIEIPKGYGSQADVTSILLVGDALESKEQHYQFYHELSHLWNVPMLDPLPCRFEGEGLAMFLQHLTQEKLENKSSALNQAFEKYKKRYLDQLTKHPEYRKIPMIDHGKESATDLSYSKGMLFFTVLYNTLGEKSFFSLMAGFYQKYAAGAFTSDFATYLKDYPQKDLSLLVDDWIYGTKSTEQLLNNETLPQLTQHISK